MLSYLVRIAVGLASARRKLLILTYHRVLAERDPLMPEEPTREESAEQLEALSSCATILPLGAALSHMQSGTLPAAAVSLTFDDGYRDNYTVAAPVLTSFGVGATFFVATGFMDGGAMWNDQAIETLRRHTGKSLDLTPLGLGVYDMSTDQARTQAVRLLLSKLKYLPPEERAKTVAAIADAVGSAPREQCMMTPDEIVGLRRAGMEIGAHTVSHPILAKLDSAAADDEIAASKKALERILGDSIELFAYPNGKPGVDYKPEHVESVRRSGFTAAVTTATGYASAHSDRLQLPRIALWQREPLRTQVQLLRSYLGA